MNAAHLGLLALLPLMVGTTAHSDDSDAISVALCNGGEITIDLGRGDNEQERDCHQNGCHAGACREKSKTKPTRAN